MLRGRPLPEPIPRPRHRLKAFFSRAISAAIQIDATDVYPQVAAGTRAFDYRRDTPVQYVEQACVRGARQCDRNIAGAHPQYDTLPGWSRPTRGVTEFDDLPAEAQQYIRRLEEVSGVPCAIVSTGSDRNETIIKRGSIVEGWLS